MSREEFIKNYLSSVGAFVYEKSLQDPHTRVTMGLVGSIWDLQQQINQLQDQLFDVWNDRRNEKAAQQAKKDKIAYAKEHLDLDWGDDEKHWKGLSKRFGFRLPVYYQPNTETKYIKKLFRKVGVDIQLYLADCGVTTLKWLNAMNPREPAFVSVGFSLEWLDEYFEENK